MAAPSPSTYAEVVRTLADALEACAQALRRLADVPAEAVASPYLPIKSFCRQYPLYTESALRSLLFHRATNGLQAAVVEVGDKVFIDVAAFFRWVEQHKQRSLSNVGVILPPPRRRGRQAR